MAWTGNFKDQIDNLAGTLTVPDDAAIQQWILDGCYDVMSKAVAKHGEDEIWKFVAKSGSETSNDIDIDELRTIAGVMRNNVFAVKGKWQLKAKYADTGSIYAATAGSPVWYLDDSKLSIYPAPDGSNPTNYYYVPEYVLTNWNTSTSSVNNYPSEYYYYAMLYGAIQVLGRRMLDSSTPTALVTLSITAVVPDEPTLATITYTGPSTSDVSSAPTVGTTAYVLPSASTAFSSRLANFSALASFSVTATAPTSIPPDPAIVSPTVGTVALANITGSIPSYSSVGVGSSATLGALATLSIDDLSITAVPPDAPTIGAISYTNVSPATATVADIATVTSYTITSVVDPSASQPTYASPTSPTRPDFESSVTDEDEDIVSMKAQQYQSDLSAFQSELSDAMNEFNEDNAIYNQLAQQAGANATAINQAALQNMQKDLQIAQANNQKLVQIAQINTANAQQALMQDAIQQVQDVIANNNSLIQVYQADLSAYQAEVGTEVQEYTNNLQKKSQLWQQTNSTILQEHSQKMQDALNVFNKENAQYQANVQAQMSKFQVDAADAMKESDLTIQAQIQDYTFELQKWQQSLGQYQAEVNTEVQAFTQNLQMELQTWQAEQANAIQQYQMETADNIKTADIANQAKLAQGQADLHVAVRDKDKQLEREIQNATNEMQEIIQNNQALLAKYQTDTSAYQAEVQEQIEENAQNLQKFNADLQAEGIGYQWLQDQYGRLKMEYERALTIAQPQA